jgi:hypothetical protein
MHSGFGRPAWVAGFVLAVMAGVTAFDHFAYPPPAMRRHAPIHVRRHPDGSLERGLRNKWVSNNWSGYELAYFQTGQKYVRTQMRWVVPSVGYGPSTDSTSSPQYSANWVGIGGFCENSLCFRADKTLIQLGTEQDVTPDGATQYYAWYEILPQIETPLPARYVVRPGDMMAASLRCLDRCAAERQIWRLTMIDQTQGWAWSKTLTYGSSMLSAEWIVEAPYGGNTLPLADFGSIGLSATAGVNGRTPSLSASVNAIQITDPWGQTSNPSAATPLADFNACWGYQTDATCPMP